MITYFQEKGINIEELIKISTDLRDNNLESENCLSIISVSAYYPTQDKNNLLTKKYVNDMSVILQKVLSDKLIWQFFKDLEQGPMIFLGLKDDAIDVKKFVTYFEDNHILGKWMVIEVYDTISRNIITREMLGLPVRKCVVCEGDLKDCVENEKHTVFDIIREMSRSYVEFIEGIE